MINYSRIGEILVSMGFVTSEQLNEALYLQTVNPHLKLGELLISLQYITPDVLKIALQKQSKIKTNPGICFDIAINFHKASLKEFSKQLQTVRSLSEQLGEKVNA